MMFSDSEIDLLRADVSANMSPYRFIHTAEVEKMAIRLGELYAPDKIDLLRVAALLHDITKEFNTEGQLKMLADHGETVTEADKLSPKTLHQRTAALLIPERYPSYANSEVINAVRIHTTGSADMTLCDCLVYLADYIDMSRSFPDCVRLRNYFFDAEPQKMDAEQRLEHLWKTLVLSFDMILNALVADGEVISPDTVSARNVMLTRLAK